MATRAEDVALATQLAAAGFFTGLEPQVAQQLEDDIRAGRAGFFDHPWRSFDADDEEVAEAGALDLLETFAPAWAALDLAPLIACDRMTDRGRYELVFADETVTLLTESEHEQQEASYAWGVIPARLYAFLNRRLEYAGKPDRFYSMLSGNDAIALLLTPEMLAVIDAIPMRAADRPYLRTEEPPSFGQRLA